MSEPMMAKGVLREDEGMVDLRSRWCAEMVLSVVSNMNSHHGRLEKGLNQESGRDVAVPLTVGERDRYGQKMS